MNDPPRMDKDRNEVAERILHFTLEILHLLTGEDYTIVKKTWGECVAPSSHLHESGGPSRARGPIKEPPLHSLINEQKILELTHRITELLTGEVPIRCQDVAVYFSMEEWEYVEGHKDLYQDIVMMEDHRPFTSQDGVIDRNPPERCPRPLYSQDCPEGNVPEINQGEDLMDIKVEVKVEPEEETDFWADQQYGVMDRNPPERCPRPLYSQDCPEGNVPEKHQGGDLTNYKVEDEEERMRGHHPCMREVKEEIPGGVTPGNPSKNSEGNFMLFLNDRGDGEIMERSSGEDLLTPNVHPYLSYNNPPDHEESSPDQPHIFTTTEQKESESLQCDECGKQFTRRSDLVIHSESHTEEKPYVCSVSEKPYITQSHLQLHEKSHTEEKTYLCLECGKCFVDRSSLVMHEIIHADEKPYSCLECGKCFGDRSSLVMHEKSHTGEEPYTCSECGKYFVGKTSLALHESSHTGIKAHSCSECGKCFTRKSHLVKHEKIHTGENPYPYSCSECGKCFKCKSHLLSHARSHLGEKLHSCSECGKRFTRKAALVKHERSHTEENSYLCLECGKCFITNVELIRHKRSHTGEKPYSCSECGKCFAYKSRLDIHEKGHTEVKPYSCSECGKCFKVKSSLLAHARSHTGEKPYSCSECGKCFASKSYCVMHERSHTGEKPHSCSECGRSFIWKSQLVAHESSHTGERPL
ncbi:zinc finger protein ZFP2-like [Hyla sarda]|uniref:zinc finger protein ZFP2-like n=1 Tax=Hyla sarda TaxID=327740 RepID=UPI0024C2B653|nr:zinc finger protein ZFP2-like [Hyla sarda]